MSLSFEFLVQVSFYISFANRKSNFSISSVFKFRSGTI